MQTPRYFKVHLQFSNLSLFTTDVPRDL